MFAVARDRANVTYYDQVLRQHLDEPTRRYWDSRTLSGRRRIDFFARNIYRFGLLGRCISSGHVLARMLGADPRRLMDARTREEQIAIFEREIAPLFDRRVVRWLLDHRVSLFGLGIPPAQYADLGSGTPSGMADTVRQRLRRLACDHDFSDNYFAWQAFNRAYPPICVPRTSTQSARACPVCDRSRCRSRSASAPWTPRPSIVMCCSMRRIGWMMRP
jgi:S-adenosylmethionine-diacylglycerol 3-amino-3-carboxypropyl transferase